MREGVSNGVAEEGQGVGSEHFNAKLTWEDVREIRRLAALGRKRLSLAATYRVTETNIRHILAHRTWKEKD